VIHRFGEPKQLKVEDVPMPVPRADEVLVAVKAAHGTGRIALRPGL